MSIHERWKSNPALYRKLGEPRPVADAEAAVGKFHEAVGKLREEHGILNCAVVVSVPIVAEESETGEGIGTMSFCYGDPMACSMIANVMAEILRADVEELIGNKTIKLRN